VTSGFRFHGKKAADVSKSEEELWLMFCTSPKYRKSAQVSPRQSLYIAENFPRIPTPWDINGAFLAHGAPKKCPINVPSKFRFPDPSPSHFLLESWTFGTLILNDPLAYYSMQHPVGCVSADCWFDF